MIFSDVALPSAGDFTRNLGCEIKIITKLYIIYVKVIILLIDTDNSDNFLYSLQ